MGTATQPLADAAVPGGTAVPVERYLLDGLRLTIVVSYNGTCKLVDVLVAWAEDVLDVVVVYGPTAATATRAPSRKASTSCLTDPRRFLAVVANPDREDSHAQVRAEQGAAGGQAPTR